MSRTFEIRIFAVLFTLVLSGAVLWFIGRTIRFSVIHSPALPSALLTDTILVHFTHGSIPRRSCPEQERVAGGFFGGHIEIQSGARVVGFLSKVKPVNIFPQKKFNSTFEVHDSGTWRKNTVQDRISSVHLPVSAHQKYRVDSILDRYLNSSPYDYAFFGQRCTSSTIGILAHAGIFTERSALEHIIAFFYPKLLRYTLLRYAEKHQLRVDYQEGSECRKWE